MRHNLKSINVQNKLLSQIASKNVLYSQVIKIALGTFTITLQKVFFT